MPRRLAGGCVADRRPEGESPWLTSALSFVGSESADRGGQVGPLWGVLTAAPVTRRAHAKVGAMPRPAKLAA